LVDTPGFNDTNKTDAEVLTMIADWLKKTCVTALTHSFPLLTICSYKLHVKLAGIIYLHRISDNRMSGSPLKNLQMFGKLCGDGAIKNVVLATTMWSKVKPDVGERREKELEDKYWREMLNMGSQMMRFGDTFDTAWRMIDQVVMTAEDDKDNALLLQEELVDLNRRLSETEAGKTLYTKLLELLAQQKETINKLREEAKAEQNEQLAQELGAQYEEMQDALQSTFDQLAKMKVSLGRRLVMLFSFRRPRAVSSSLFHRLSLTYCLTACFTCQQLVVDEKEKMLHRISPFTFAFL
jgi:F0F1-type ATP synthase membrane subunit b/b'